MLSSKIKAENKVSIKEFKTYLSNPSNYKHNVHLLPYSKYFTELYNINRHTENITPDQLEKLTKIRLSKASGDPFLYEGVLYESRLDFKKEHPDICITNINRLRNKYQLSIPVCIDYVRFKKDYPRPLEFNGKLYPNKRVLLKEYKLPNSARKIFTRKVLEVMTPEELKKVISNYSPRFKVNAKGEYQTYEYNNHYYKDIPTLLKEESIDLPIQTVYKRLAEGWSLEKSLTTPKLKPAHPVPTIYKGVKYSSVRELREHFGIGDSIYKETRKMARYIIDPSRHDELVTTTNIIDLFRAFYKQYNLLEPQGELMRTVPLIISRGTYIQRKKDIPPFIGIPDTHFYDYFLATVHKLKVKQQENPNKEMLLNLSEVVTLKDFYAYMFLYNKDLVHYDVKENRYIVINKTNREELKSEIGKRYMPIQGYTIPKDKKEELDDFLTSTIISRKLFSNFRVKYLEDLAQSKYEGYYNRTNNTKHQHGNVDSMSIQ